MRRALFALLAVLLLAMQHEGLVHPLAHLQLTRAHDTGLTAPSAGDACAECALLAASGNVAAGALRHAGAHAPITAHVRNAFHSRAADVPAWFHSRAPPSVLL
jgi:hypothetical protein